MTKSTKKTKEAKIIKMPSPKKVADDAKPGIGHNSNGQVIPGLVKIVEELLSIGEQKKALGKAERDLRNQAKTEFGVLSGPLAHEMRLRKMDSDVRVQFESSHADLKAALGYQPELDFVNGTTPTQASLKAQPSEAELKAGEEGFHVSDDEEDDTEETDETEGEPNGNVITREG